MSRNLVTKSFTISTHALREEGDGPRLGAAPPGRISTHALREEGDRRRACWASGWPDFYPRPP